jgi:hypothetical protein
MLATELTTGSDTALDDSVVADVDKIKQSAVATRRWLRGRGDEHEGGQHPLVSRAALAGQRSLACVMDVT